MVLTRLNTVFLVGSQIKFQIEKSRNSKVVVLFKTMEVKSKE